MPAVAKTLIDEVLRRVRDVHGLAHSREFTRTIVSHCQRLINASLGIVTTSTAFATYAHQQFYSISGLLTGDEAIVKVKSIRDGAKDLTPVTNIKQFAHLDLRWVRAVGPSFNSWTHLGRDLLVIYPAKSINSSVTIIGTKLTIALTGEDTALELPDEYHDHVISLAEVMLLAKQRDLSAAIRQLQRLSTALKLDLAPLRLHMGEDESTVNLGTVERTK